jgi:hypothetical protein
MTGDRARGSPHRLGRTWRKASRLVTDLDELEGVTAD